jgi:predicted nuclease of restriction endonuclease-like RecB superfamily
LLPEMLLRHSVRGEIVVPHFLGASDLPWLRVLLDDADRFSGRPQRELDDHLRGSPPAGCPAGKRRLAIHVLRRLLGSRHRSAVPPTQARAAVFTAAATSKGRAEILEAVAASVGVTIPELEESLFSDLPGERLVVLPEKPLAPLELALRANLSLAQGFLSRATSIVIEAEGNARTLVRHAKLRGLICTVAARASSGDAVLEISGPFALFRRTLVYGRALAELLPLCAWCQRFQIRARCVLQERSLQLELASGDPIFPSQEPRRFDSQVEERFARDFGRLARDWDVIREPEPIASEGTLIFPDFALQHRHNPARRCLLEIVGFWTADYLTRKLAQYAAAGLNNLIMCIDEDRDCAGGDLPAGAVVIRYRRRVDPHAVLTALETMP